MTDTRFFIKGWAHCILSFSILGTCVLANPVFQDHQLWEGNECELAGGGSGRCLKAKNCPKKVLAIQQGNYTTEERCGFSGLDEIVCCEKTVSKTIRVDRVRPAVAACEKYKKLIKGPPLISVQPVSFIVVGNGEKARPGEFPQMVALGYRAEPDEEFAINGMKYICGGTLISEQHVLTAAHCVSNPNDFIPVEVVLGTIYLDRADNGQMQRISISKIIKHPQYRRALHYHDIALIKLEHPVLFTDYVKPACLVTEPLEMRTDRSEIKLVVLGWGAIDLYDTRSTKLVKADWLKFIDASKCSANYKHVGARIPNGLNEGMICAADPDGRRKSNTCSGDSGGPLFIKQFLFPPLVGVTSFGHGCGTNLPGVYASVYKYLDWIEAQVWPNGTTDFIN